MWLKGYVIARCFIESHVAHPFIARVLKVFIAVSPIALVITAFFGATVARWATALNRFARRLSAPLAGAALMRLRSPSTPRFAAEATPPGVVQPRVIPKRKTA